MTWRRAAIAGTLGLLFPGVGHAYLRKWFRALAWFGFALLTAALVLPDQWVTAFETGGFDALMSRAATPPDRVVLSTIAVRVINAFDAVLVALRDEFPGRGSADGPTCPHCGRELDDDLDFCHWCTTRIEEADAENDLA